MNNKRRQRIDEWRDRYFDGWLPPNGVIVPQFEVPLQPEIAEAVANIDRRKVHVALYVIERYPRHLLQEG